MTTCEKRRSAWENSSRPCGKPAVARIQADGAIGEFVCATHCDQALRLGQRVRRLTEEGQ